MDNLNSLKQDSSHILVSPKMSLLDHQGIHVNYLLHASKQILEL